ncbi:MAG: DUF4346 domain-containing protein [Candidatus Aenigmarchaeota archaeon]|nr:DUF4346 domain-containing protein [Candidatus Aenigmarchaeota archaeon]
MNGWPVTDGRYKIGDEKSPIAICTQASVDLIEKIPLDDVAIIGKLVTENIGIEKIVKNIISNPNIRFLIICGKPSKGHFVDNALCSLIENGVDKNKRIIGAKGAMPVVKNLTQNEIEIFRKQITPVNINGEESVEKIIDIIKKYKEKNPGPFKQSKKIDEKKVREIVAFHNDDEYKQDKKGFFIIKINYEKREIIVEYYNNDRELLSVIKGKNAVDIYYTILRENMVSEMTHAAYLGKELARAEHAMKNKLDYEQDKG